MKATLFTLLIVQLSILNLWAQPAPLKWGKVDKKDLEMTVYPEDPEAAAVVLADYGTVHFDYHRSDGIGIRFDRIVRIKILKKAGMDQANISIPLYKKGEDIGGAIKGISYNLEGGKVVESELEKSQIFKEELNDYFNQMNFTIPNVKEGTVFEYKYSINSTQIFNLVDWAFQREIPTRWSELRVEIPEYFHYKTVMGGYLPLTVSNITKKTDFNRVLVTNFQWAIANTPALKEEKYMTTMSDFTSKMEFELQTISIPGKVFENFSHTWEKVNRDLNSDDDFGKQIGRGKYLSELVLKLCADATTPEEKAKNITLFVRENIKYNGRKRVFLSQKLKNVLEEKTGNSADINLLLVSMLQEAGLEANPVILSTRENGRLNISTPLLKDFNYVVAHVRLKDGYFLLDGTNPELPYDMLPFYCLNQQGRLISPEYSTFVPLHNKEKFKESVAGTFKVEADGSLNGELKWKEYGYGASVTRSKIKADGEEKYLEWLKGEHSNWIVTEYSNSNFEDVNQELEESFKLQLTSVVTPAADRMYFQPMVAGAEKENPFKLEKREFPVDFGCAREEMYMYQFLIPEGYIIEELPEPAVFALPEKGGVFRYVVSGMGNKISVTSILKIDQTMFVGDQYQLIKQFYDLVVAKQAEQVVLKRVN